MDKTLITKYDIDDKYVYAKILFKPNENDLFAITTYEDSNSWSGEFSYDDAKKYMELLVLDTEEQEQYCDNVIKALSKQSDYSFDFTIDSDDCNIATFSWIKKLRSGVLIHGSVLVHRDGITESKDSLLDLLILENLELKNKLSSVNLRNQELSQSLDKCMKSLDEAAEVKVASEELLYGKFVQLLNTKKRRIKLLEDTIAKYSKPN